LLEYGTMAVHYGDCSMRNMERGSNWYARNLTLSHITWVYHTLLHKGQDGSTCRKKTTAQITRYNESSYRGNQ